MLLLIMTTDYLLINFDNPNTKTEQISILNNLLVLLNKFDLNLNIGFIFAGDNLIFF